MVKFRCNDAALGMTANLISDGDVDLRLGTSLRGARKIHCVRWHGSISRAIRGERVTSSKAVSTADVDRF